MIPTLKALPSSLGQSEQLMFIRKMGNLFRKPHWIERLQVRAEMKHPLLRQPLVLDASLLTVLQPVLSVLLPGDNCRWSSASLLPVPGSTASPGDPASLEDSGVPTL